MKAPDALRTWLNERAPQLRCPVCQRQAFSVDTTIAMTNSIDPETTRINYMAGFPLVALACSWCGHVLFFNAKTIGVMQ